jgi:periplasmic divalent cation tolerance protein
MTDVVLVLTTVPAGGDQGETIARTLVEDRLAACVNVHGPMVSFYRWRGAVERDTERQLVIKTTLGKVAAVEARLRELHSYELAELVVVSVAEGSAPYLDWVSESVR